MRWPGPDGYWASDERALIDLARVHAWISRESYWAEGRPRDAMARAVENSLVLGLYSAEGTQVPQAPRGPMNTSLLYLGVHQTHIHPAGGRARGGVGGFEAAAWAWSGRTCG